MAKELSLTVSEKRLAVYIAKILSMHRGSACAMTADDIIVWLQHWVITSMPLGYFLTPPKVREIIHYIMANDKAPCLVETSAGFYVADRREDILNYIDFLRREEENIRATRLALVNQMNKAFPVDDQLSFKPQQPAEDNPT